jgi:D-apionolactonase
MSNQLISENRISLKTSKLSCFFEPETGFLRQVTVDGCEVVRAIYGAVRDQHWNTVQPQIFISSIATGEEQFLIEFQVECKEAEIAFHWAGTIEGRAGFLCFKFAGESKSAFKKNRIGLCLLHPIHECAGKRCRVRKVDESWVEAEFPFFISPHQPFKGLGAMSWEPTPGLRATVNFAGDEFETEDQRNWTDASFKTYCTPLEKPFPVEIKPGARVDQSITLELSWPEVRTRVAAHGVGQELISVNSDGEKSLPSLGICANGHNAPLIEAERSRLAALKLGHLRIDIRLDDEGWRRSLVQATAEAKAIRTRIQTALFFSEEEELRAFAAAVDRQILEGCLLFHNGEPSTSEHWLEIASQLLPRTAVVGGTNANFADLNRHRPAASFPAAFSINPQVHAFDDLSLMENLEAQPETIHSARQFSDFDLYVSPITLRPRSYANSSNLTIAEFHRLPSSVDIRQRTLFGAAWTVGSLARLLPMDGVKSLTFYETTGWKGLMETGQGSPLPDLFQSKPGEIFPVYYVFHALAGAKALFPVTNPAPQKIAVIGFGKDEGMHVLLANLQSKPSIARIRLPGHGVENRILCEQNAEEARQGILPGPESLRLSRGEVEIALPSYALAILRCT